MAGPLSIYAYGVKTYDFADSRPAKSPQTYAGLPSVAMQNRQFPTQNQALSTCKL